MGIRITIDVVHLHGMNPKTGDHVTDAFASEIKIQSTNGGACPHESDLARRVKFALAALCCKLKILAIPEDDCEKLFPLIASFAAQNEITVMGADDPDIAEALGMHAVKNFKKPSGDTPPMLGKLEEIMKTTVASVAEEEPAQLVPDTETPPKKILH